MNHWRRLGEEWDRLYPVNRISSDDCEEQRGDARISRETPRRRT